MKATNLIKNKKWGPEQNAKFMPEVRWPNNQLPLGVIVTKAEDKLIM